MAYRVELSKTGRATCVATVCKKEGTKIEKGDLRQAVMVTINENQSWKCRHWGCVTPQILHNWKETCGMDMELVDGYDELPEAAQKKVKRAIEQEHVDDDEWNGDVECNRYIEGKKNQGMFLKTPTKSSKKANGEDEGGESGTKKKLTKKRSRKTDEADEDNGEPEPKKAKGSRAKKAAKAEESEEEPAPVKKTKKSKAAAPEPEEPVATKTKKSKAAASEPEEPEPTKPKKKTPSKQSKAKAEKEVEDEPKPAPRRKGRGRKAAAAEDE